MTGFLPACNSLYAHIGHFLHQYNSGWGSMQAILQSGHTFINLLYLGVNLCSILGGLCV